MSVEGKQVSPVVKSKPKKKSLVERELESSLTDKFIVPAIADKSLSSRYGRARRLKTDNDFYTLNKLDTTKSPQNAESPLVYRMHASNSPRSIKKTEESPNSLIESIHKDNIINDSIKKSSPKIYIRKDLIQSNGKEGNFKYVKNIFSPVSSTYTPSNSHLKNYLERSSEKYSLNKSENLIDMSSVVKTLDFDGNKKKNKTNGKQNISKSEIFEMEAKCEYQVGDLAWARMGTYPFWPCIVTRDPESDTFVKKKLFGRVEHDIINVTFFGDNGRHSWVVDNMLRPYQGKNEFLDVREKFSIEDKKKDPRLYAAFFVSEKKQTLWNMSVEEAETLLKEPKRLRIDLFNNMLWQSRALKVNSKKVGKVTRTDSDVSLSESLYDTLFSEGEIKDESQDRSRKKKKNKGLDVSDVVTACLDNMAAKTGITTIQKQSHMDRWLQKAKSKTPEKNQINHKTEKGDLKISSKKPLSSNTSSEESVKSSSDTSRNTSRDRLRLQRPTLNNKKLRTRSSRRLSRKSQEPMNTSLTSFENEHDYSSNFVENIENQSLVMNENDSVIGYVPDNSETNSVFGVITKVERMSDDTYESSHEIETSVVNDDIIRHESDTFTEENSLDTSKSSNLINDFDSSLKDNASLILENETKNKSCNINEENNELEEENITKSNEKVLERELTILQPTTSQVKLSDNINHQNMLSGDVKQIEKHKQGNTNKPLINHNENTEVQNDKPSLLNGIKDSDTNNSYKHIDKISNNSVVKTSSGENSETIDPKSSEVSLELNTHTSCDNKETEIKHTTMNGVIDEVDATLQEEPMKVYDNCVQNETDNKDTDIPIKQDNNSKVLLDIQNTELSITEDSITSSPFEFTNNDKLNKESSPERFDDFDTESVNSESSEIPCRNKNKDSDTISIRSSSSNSSSMFKRSKNDKQLIDFNNIDASKVLEDSNFKKYLELRQDQIMEENPELSENEVIKYLYKTWIYEESSKGDKKMTVGFDGFNIVKGLGQEKLTSKPKLKVNKMYSKVKLETITKSCDESEGISKRSLRARLGSYSHNSCDNKDTKIKDSSIETNTKHTTMNGFIDEFDPTLQEEPTKVSDNCVQNERDLDIGNKKDTDIPINQDNNSKVLLDKQNTELSLTEGRITSSPFEFTNNDKLSKASSPERFDDFDTESINSESSEIPRRNENKDSDTISIRSSSSNSSSKSKRCKNDKQSIDFNNIDASKVLEDSNFKKYFEMRQDQIMEETPELSENEVIKYLYKTWIYEESSKGDKKMNDCLDGFNVVKGLVHENPTCKPKRKVNKMFSKFKLETITQSCDERESISKRSLRSRLQSNSHNSCDNKDTEIKDPSIETDIKHTSMNGVIDEVDPTLQEEPTKVSENCVQNETDLDSGNNKDADIPIKQDNNSKVLLDIQNTELSITEGRITRSPFEFTNNDKLSKESSPERFDDFDTESINSESSEIPRRNKNKDSDTISIKSNSSNSSSKSKRSKNDKQLIDFNNIDVTRVLEESDFKKYLDLRQDQVMEENPELSQNEVIKYLYKTWIYEENAKGDKKMTDDFDGYNVVKGLGQGKPITKPKRKINKIYSNVKLETITQSCDESEGISKRSLRSRTNSPYESLLRSTSASPADFLKEAKVVLTKMEDENDLITKDIDSEVASIDSESSDIPLIMHKIKQNKAKATSTVETTTKQSDKTVDSSRKKDKEVQKVNKVKELKNLNDAMESPEFIKYLEIKQDNITDEHPELTQDEIVFYLYKTWLYEEGSKSETNRIDELEQENLVKGLNTDAQVTKIKKKVKTESKIDKFLVDTEVKDKPKRNVANPVYTELYDDFEDEIKYFEIFSKNHVKGKKVSNENKTEHSTDSEEIESPKFEPIGETSKESNFVQNTEEIVQTDVYDKVEQYFQNLTKPKPNLFKGLVREKVCEICEKPAELEKCKGCHQMFHPECVKKETEIVEAPQLVRGRKKKKKPRGRKPKNLDDSIESDGDEKNDLNTSDEKFNISMEAFEPIVTDADNFEKQFQEKIKEIMDVNKNPYECIPSNYAIDWTKSVAGNCEIIDVSPPQKPEIDYSDFKCNNCQKCDVPICFVCKSPVSKNGVEERQKCHCQHCYKYYHLECLGSWPQTQFTGDTKRKLNEHFNPFTCPRHVCHTCVCDDPRGCRTRFNGEKLARCVRCPATYHTFTKCLPAGTQILSGSHIVCPRHYEHRPGKVPCHVNTGWCFICALGGTLICCEYCPTSFHAECLNIKPPEGGYMCEDCETGRLPLYGEMVWVKLGHYRWWPGMILHPSEIPNNIMAVRHSAGEFVVRFFGQYDHYWVNRGRVFPFQEGDSGRVSSQKSKIDAAFTMAMEHAQRACEILKNALPNHEESDIASSLLPPHYVKLKVNKPIGSLVGKRVDLEESSLTQCDCDPREIDPCGPYTHCLNRMLLTECGPSCKAGDRCQNRAFEKREYPKMVPYRTPHRGWGLKTLEDIKMGQFVIEYVGELLDEDEFRRRMAKMHEIRDENFYFLTLDKERMIDAGPKGNLARFMNHCCEPNCETQKWTVLGDVRVGLFALRDIPAGSEVTFNYNLECAGIEKKKCMCGAKLCSGYIGAKPKQDESQIKKLKRTYKKKPKQIEESPTIKTKPKPRTTSRSRPKEMTEIEKDLLIIKNATNSLSSDSESGRINSIESDKVVKPLKRKRVSFSTDNEVILINGDIKQDAKRLKTDVIGDFGD